MLIEVRSAEQPGAHLCPVVDTAVVAEDGVRPDRRAERIQAQGRPPVEEGEVDAGTLIRDEPPWGDPLRRRAGAYATAAYEVEEFARLLTEPLELDPEVADRSTDTVRTAQQPIILWTARQNSGHLAAST